MTPQEKSFLDRFLKGITVRSAITIVSVAGSVLIGAFKLYNKFDTRITRMETKQDIQFEALKDKIENMPQCHCNGQHNETLYGAAGIVNNH